VDFRNNVRPGVRETFAKLALGQSPDALFIGCSDSRVAVNVFASTDPGDLFVVRNVGNLVPPSGDGATSDHESEAAAIEFALEALKVSHIVVCGHSECGAMQALVKGRESLSSPNLKSWLQFGEVDLSKVKACPQVDTSLALHDQLSQFNVLNQLEHLKTYPLVRERLEKGELQLHAWWFELRQAEVYAFDKNQEKFTPFDEEIGQRILARLN